MATLRANFSALGLLRSFAPILLATLGLAGLCFGALTLAKDSDLLVGRTIVLIVGMIPLALVVLLAIVYFKLAFRKGVAVEFDELGIRHARVGWPVIEWDQIERLEIQKVSSSHFLAIYPKSKLPDRIKIDPSGAATFGIDGLSCRRGAMIEWLQANRPGLLSS